MSNDSQDKVQKAKPKGPILRIETAGDINKASLSLGESSDSDFTFVRGTAAIPCDDGTTVLASYEVVAFA